MTDSRVDRWTEERVPRAIPMVARAAPRRLPRRRLGCVYVARKRTRHYAMRRRIPKPLWPLISLAIVIWLIFDRRPLVDAFWKSGPLVPDSGGTGQWPAQRVEDRTNCDLGGGLDANGCLLGAAEPLHRPPADFLAKDVVQIVAFILRNRGRLDNDAVRSKWGIIDRISLPLAVYLREVEAKGTWDDLEKEISAAPFGAPAASGRDLPTSPRHRKLLRLLPVWTQRGEELMSALDAHDMDLASALDGRPDDEPDKEPTGPRRG